MVGFGWSGPHVDFLCANMDWFEQLTGFTETSYHETRRQLSIKGQTLHSQANGRSFGIGTLELVALQTLRERVATTSGCSGRIRVSNVSGDVRAMHSEPQHQGALFQVASQFNLLEMASPHASPEDGVTIYQYDHTQGPACAIAAGAGTIYRNYFAPIGTGTEPAGQTRDRQLNGLADIGAQLSVVLARPVETLWTMQNGYALCTAQALAEIGVYLGAADPAAVDHLRGLLRIGLHHDVAVTDVDAPPHPVVSQAYCSALHVAYCDHVSSLWQPFAQLVLEAAYEATMCAAVLNTRRGGSKVVLLTRLGGGVFGNQDAWIDAAMHRALEQVREMDLDVRLVSYGAVPQSMTELAQAFG